jgi:hypothetical protein
MTVGSWEKGICFDFIGLCYLNRVLFDLDRVGNKIYYVSYLAPPIGGAFFVVASGRLFSWKQGEAGKGGIIKR